MSLLKEEVISGGTLLASFTEGGDGQSRGEGRVSPHLLLCCPLSSLVSFSCCREVTSGLALAKGWTVGHGRAWDSEVRHYGTNYL